ncbi:hypothetical protein D8674_004496 [Pyrus ussuriensis x Pyrus communis]|uniref:Pectinesterase inhibitor domain-containing protein n=1 Tax=Pyrus ussuriensis x Pyrus communis TaxID=2448454 RepID=A0A5N5FPC7_9ROSA|nr:hypothetical protein D8674_004496 [Pyrus ussuriensis x Pyrus communis]
MHQMESPIHYVLPFFFTSSFLFLSSPSPMNASIHLVETVCKKTISNSECLKVFDSDPRSSSASNYKELAIVALELAIANAKDSQNFMNNLLNSDPRKPIKLCSYFYGGVVGSFNSAKKEIGEDPLTANYDVKIAGDAAGYCETALSSEGVEVSKISTRNHVVKLYSSIGYVITDQLA